MEENGKINQEIEVSKASARSAKVKKLKLKKKPLLIAAGAVIVIAVGVFCVMSGVLPILGGEDGRYAVDAKDVLFNKETLPRVDASVATQPMMDAFVQNFTGKSAIEMEVGYSDTHLAYAGLIDGEKDLIVATEPSDNDLEYAKEKGVELEMTKVAKEAFIFLVNRENPVTNISLQNLVKIYTGEITNWSELGGNDAEIIVYQRPVDSGSRTVLQKSVLKDKTAKNSTERELATFTPSSMIDYIGDYEGAVNAIGYTFYYHVNTMYYNDHLKYLAIDGVEPTYAAVQDGTYPILTNYYVVTRKGESNDKVKELRAAILSKRGQYVISTAGYVSME